MDLRGWESLWKIFATIGIANLLLFVVIVFVNEVYNSILIWILIAIETTCYLGVLIVRRHIRQLLRLNYLGDIRNTMAPHKRINIPIPIIIIPLTVQPGLLYINEEGGPT